METKRYEFTVRLCGHGDTPEQAWIDAVESFGLDPGIPFEDDVEEIGEN